MSDPKPPTVDEIADWVLPYDGPYSREAVIMAGQVLAELVRRLNNVTLSERTRADVLPYPADTDALLHSLTGTLSRMDQLLMQLCHQVGSYADNPDVEAAGKTLGAPDAEPAPVAMGAMNNLIDARDYLGRATAALQETTKYTSRLRLGG